MCPALSIKRNKIDVVATYRLKLGSGSFDLVPRLHSVLGEKGPEESKAIALQEPKRQQRPGQASRSARRHSLASGGMHSELVLEMGINPVGRQRGEENRECAKL